jgi:hypothetical protein
LLLVLLSWGMQVCYSGLAQFLMEAVMLVAWVQVMQ